MAENTTVHYTLTIDGVSADLKVGKFESRETISELFEMRIRFSSDEHDLDLTTVVGKGASLAVLLEDQEQRQFSGIVSVAEHLGAGKKLAFYEITVVPKFWRLQHRHDSRIFQELSVPDIVKKVLDGAGLASGDDYRLNLQGSYSPREYCVQYRESDHAFVSRLLEEEGIFYFFEHADGKATMVLADKPSANAPISGTAEIAFKHAHGAISMGENVSSFTSSEAVRPGKVTLRDFDFKKPSLSLEGSASGSVDTDLEVYDYPGEYVAPSEGSAYAAVRLEEWQARKSVANGASGCLRFVAGYKFTLTEHTRDAVNREWLLVEVHHTGAQPHVMEDVDGGAVGYKNTFRAIASDIPFRPERRTPRPTLKGIQTAIVTGPGGEEIHTDEFGRVKVQFHWDRQGKKDDKSSCWMRVSQLWAGEGWGAMWIPRIGQEVVVDFIEGDPDRPLITGRVYHGTNVVPYGLPGNKTRSTIKSNSTPGGGGSNELRFEDKKGSEEIYLHGQKDWNIKIEHDKNQWIGHDETKKVEHDETYEIGNDQTLTVDHDRKKEVKHDEDETIGNDKRISVGGHHSETISKTETHTVALARSVNVGGAHSEAVGGIQEVTVGGLQSINVGAAQSTNVGGSHSLQVGGSTSEMIGANKSVETGGAYTLKVSKDLTVTISKNMKEDVGEERTLVVAKKLAINVGDAQILLQKDGTITLQGKDITLKASGKVLVDASSKVDLKSSGPVNIDASGKVTIKGSQVGVN